MFIVRTVILSIIVGFLLFKSAKTGNICAENGNFSVEKLEGKWRWVAYTDDQRRSLRCGQFTSSNVSNTHFIASRSVRVDNSYTQKLRMKGILDNFDINLRDYYKDGPGLKMRVLTCNNTQEFALQLQDSSYYSIYSRGSTISKPFFRYFRDIASSSHLHLHFVDNSYCNYYI